MLLVEYFGPSSEAKPSAWHGSALDLRNSNLVEEFASAGSPLAAAGVRSG
jgi:hypothetical protein